MKNEKMVIFIGCIVLLIWVTIFIMINVGDSSRIKRTSELTKEEYLAMLEEQIEQMPSLDLTAGGDGNLSLMIKESEEFRQTIEDKIVATYNYSGNEEPIKLLTCIEDFSDRETVIVLCAIESFTKSGEYDIMACYDMGLDTCIEFSYGDEIYTIVADKYIADFLICKGVLQ